MRRARGRASKNDAEFAELHKRGKAMLKKLFPMLCLLLVACQTPEPVKEIVIPKDSIIEMLKDNVQIAIPDPTVLTCDTQWPESSCIGMDDRSHIFFTGINRETDMAFIIDIKRTRDMAYVQSCKFQLSLVHEGTHCQSSTMPDAKALESIMVALKIKWPKLLEQVLQGILLK